MNTKTDEGLYEKARKLFISKASIDEFAGWATPRQVDAVHRLLDTELANRERAKHDSRQGSRRLRLHERQAPRRLHAR